MLVFLALIAFISIRKKLEGKQTVEQALLTLRALKAKIYDTEITIQEPNKRVKDLAHALKIIMPTSMEV